MKTLDLTQAAAFLHLSEDALMRKARAGIVPGSKPGRRWVFLDEHLRDYLAKLVGERACRSIAEIRAPIGGCDIQSVVSRLDAQLAQPTKHRPRSSRLGLEVAYGDKFNSGRNRATPGKRPSVAGTPKLRLVAGTGTRSA